MLKINVYLMINTEFFNYELNEFNQKLLNERDSLEE